MCRAKGGSHKTSETLLGIETDPVVSRLVLSRRHKTSETLLGIETKKKSKNRDNGQRHKTSETLLGIETRMLQVLTTHKLNGHKTSETLLGIETADPKGVAPLAVATKPLKPF